MKLSWSEKCITLITSLLLLFQINVKSQNNAALTREIDSLRLEIRLQQSNHANATELTKLIERVDAQDKLIDTFKSNIGNWISFNEIFFGAIGILIALFAYFGFTQIKHYANLAKHDQREIEKILNDSKNQQESIKNRHEELQKFNPEEVLNEQSKKMLTNTVNEAKEQLKANGFDSLKNLFQAKAIAANEASDWDNLKRYCESYLDFDDSNADIWFRWARSMQELTFYEKALKGFSKAIEIESTHKAAYNSRGNVYAKLDKFTEAMADYDKAISIDNNYARAYYNRGLLHYKFKKTDEALRDYGKAIELDPNYSNAYNNRGVLFQDLGKNQEALEDFTTAIAKDSQNEVSIKNKKDLLKLLGKN